MRKFYAIVLSVLTLLAINVPVAQCSMNKSIVIGASRCSGMYMAAPEAMAHCHPNANRCPMQHPQPTSCHMTLIHKGWSAASVAAVPPVPATVFLYTLPNQAFHWFGGIKRISAENFPSEHAPPILSTNCTLNI